MKFCPICKTQYPEDANFCPQETCATPEGPQRLLTVAPQPASRFQPIEKLGGGNTGEVWRARDNQTGTEVAYKIVAADVIGSQASQARAEREFKQLIRVTCPKLATILDCEKTAAGGLAIAMELCQGDSLERMLASGPVSFEQAKSIVAQIGLALLEAQKVGLVHRDVAPKNVLVSPSGDVKVINFPIAKPINDRVAGVPAYLSPEQVQGKPVDQRSNTYSLAAILYHLLTGEPPFQGPSVQAVLDMQVSTPALPPTQRRPGAGLPGDVDKLILKAMDKSSSRRHLTLRLFLNELDALKLQPAGAAKPASEVGLAKTMMFGGNQADIARMVAEARAAKAGTTASPPAPTAPPSAPASAVGQTIAVGPAAPQAAPHAQPLAMRAPSPPQQTLVQAPQQPSVQPARPAMTPAPQVPTPALVTPGARGVTPPPVVPQPRKATPVAAPATPPVASAQAIKPAEAGKAPPPKSGAAFRETLWFKQGDVEQMVADAKAKLHAAGKGTGDAPTIPEDARPLEDRYVDDGSVTVEDRKKFSLRTGGTATAMPSVDAGRHVPGEQINEREIVGEISGGRRTLILVIAAVIFLALVVVIAMMVKGKGKSASSAAPASVVATAVAGTQSGAAAAGSQDSGVAVGSQDSTGGGAPPGKVMGKATESLPGSAGGVTKPGVGGAASEAKAAQGKKPVVKKKPAPKHPPAKHKR
jgi:Protein kinase domain